ncbi:MAG TPA: methyltransferase domain-containing protein [Thermoanaerobaculia bacterium]|nr:methyltransferase domain-containing protein [Thermoanaerobaculia bacterium]
MFGIFRRSPSAARAESSGTRLHVGCGQEAIAGWINIDNQPLGGVDRVLDVRGGLPFTGVSAIYAEHFIEHLEFDDALAFLAECRRVLAPEGVLRLSTPNLDWVLTTQYRWQGVTAPDRVLDCMKLNRSFRAWGHQFLYNQEALAAVLRNAGFAHVSFHRYGESEHPELRGLERHERWEERDGLLHVLVAEAWGAGPREPVAAAFLREFRTTMADR